MAHSLLYTKTGDSGHTNLYDMSRLPKHYIVFEVLGDLDELSASIGIVCTLLPEKEKTIYIQLRTIQNYLLNIGSDFATQKNRNNISEISNSDITLLEEYIDFYDLSVKKLTEFILPGTTPLDSHVHMCRAICRRAERHIWKMVEDYGDIIPTRSETFKYMNRLSDYFFALARYLSNGKDITRSEINKYTS